LTETHIVHPEISKYTQVSMKLFHAASLFDFTQKLNDAC